MIFKNRAHAGEQLARALSAHQPAGPFVLAVPRGGVPVGAVVARALACPFDVIPIAKIPIPWSPNASFGVATPDGSIELNKPLVNRLELSEKELELSTQQALQEVKRRDALYRQGRPFPELTKNTVIVIDDGVASGYSMLAATHFIATRRPRGLIVASPVASDAAYRMLKAEPGLAGLVILSVDSGQFFVMSSHYREFAALTDDDVLRELARV